MDTAGNKAAHKEISGIKVAVLDVATKVVDRAIQTFGAAGVGPDTPLPRMYANVRALHFADGPDEVHRRGIARRELRRWAPSA
jgi:acyl-CoA dehydrogenase